MSWSALDVVAELREQGIAARLESRGWWDIAVVPTRDGRIEVAPDGEWLTVRRYDVFGCRIDDLTGALDRVGGVAAVVAPLGIKTERPAEGAYLLDAGALAAAGCTGPALDLVFSCERVTVRQRAKAREWIAHDEGARIVRALHERGHHGAAEDLRDLFRSGERDDALMELLRQELKAVDPEPGWLEDDPHYPLPTAFF